MPVKFDHLEFAYIKAESRRSDFRALAVVSSLHRILQQSLCDFMPRDYLANLVKVLLKLTHFLWISLEQKTLRHSSEVAQDFEPIIDEVRNTKFCADRCLAFASPTEVNVYREYPCLFKKVIVTKPVTCFSLDVRATFGDDEYLLTKSFVNQACEHFERTRNSSGIEVVA